MRAFKIILISILLFLILTLVFGAIGTLQNSMDTLEGKLALIFAVTGLVLGSLTFLFHIQTFRYYRKSLQNKRVKNSSVIFWVCAILSNVYFLIFGLFAVLGLQMDPELSNSPLYFLSVVFTFLIVLYAVLSFLEMFILKKHIAKHREEFAVQNEIDQIGN
ncbi:hypothetical protein H2O64_18410 [Kordia sp. YSTF-M3]|uniref:DUF4293 family protein n=1 Tax=Kordia aestuariivivens TaxID=2759037 RepID=A0ABR7QDN0_9FLAO|nr:hypothetical protein [Kordia aestuariivivens]MBC8756652.1 hypothetical protein [Kordia aestuariivivens]